MTEATPQHLLDCVALVYDDLLKRPDFGLEVMKANDLMDLIRLRSKGVEKKKTIFCNFFSSIDTNNIKYNSLHHLKHFPSRKYICPSLTV
ncbi:hypothetical protein AVEN_162515-1 [Araneus ventricosus]|uniref:Uncharacterized protein n=1 Tax=Araneus ventricosus TaxID=182803 RepID=A0A4Y2X289_ARAVE|nr:hypothetical protein AVEN_162515-1 [Araneus ventricosus]